MQETIQEKIDVLSGRITQLEGLLRSIYKSEDMLYKRGVRVNYEYVLRERARLMKKRDEDNVG